MGGRFWTAVDGNGLLGFPSHVAAPLWTLDCSDTTLRLLSSLGGTEREIDLGTGLLLEAIEHGTADTDR